MRFLGPQRGNDFTSLNIASCWPPIKYQERIDMERELDQLDGFFIIFPE
jgi:hypothetical protein